MYRHFYGFKLKFSCAKQKVKIAPGSADINMLAILPKYRLGAAKRIGIPLTGQQA